MVIGCPLRGGQPVFAWQNLALSDWFIWRGRVTEREVHKKSHNLAFGVLESVVWSLDGGTSGGLCFQRAFVCLEVVCQLVQRRVFVCVYERYFIVPDC